MCKIHREIWESSRHRSHCIVFLSQSPNQMLLVAVRQWGLSKKWKKSISGYNLSVTTRSQFSYQIGQISETRPKVLVPTCWGSFSRGVVISRLCFNSGKKSLPKKIKKEHNKSLLLHSLGFSSPTLFLKKSLLQYLNQTIKGYNIWALWVLCLQDSTRKPLAVVPTPREIFNMLQHVWLNASDSSLSLQNRDNFNSRFIQNI